MTILELLTSNEHAARVELNGKWIYWDETSSEWVTLTHPYGARKNKVLYRGESEEKAVYALLGTSAVFGESE